MMGLQGQQTTDLASTESSTYEKPSRGRASSRMLSPSAFPSPEKPQLGSEDGETTGTDDVANAVMHVADPERISHDTNSNNITGENNPSSINPAPVASLTIPTSESKSTLNTSSTTIIAAIATTAAPSANNSTNIAHTDGEPNSRVGDSIGSTQNPTQPRAKAITAEDYESDSSSSSISSAASSNLDDLDDEPEQARCESCNERAPKLFRVGSITVCASCQTLIRSARQSPRAVRSQRSQDASLNASLAPGTSSSSSSAVAGQARPQTRRTMGLNQKSKSPGAARPDHLQNGIKSESTPPPTTVSSSSRRQSTSIENQPHDGGQFQTTGAFNTRTTMRLIGKSNDTAAPVVDDYLPGRAVEVLNLDHIWYKGAISIHEKGKVKIQYDGWPAEWDEWVPVESRRLKLMPMDKRVSLRREPAPPKAASATLSRSSDKKSPQQSSSSSLSSGQHKRPHSATSIPTNNVRSKGASLTQKLALTQTGKHRHSIALTPFKRTLNGRFASSRPQIRKQPSPPVPVSKKQKTVDKRIKEHSSKREQQRADKTTDDRDRGSKGRQTVVAAAAAVSSKKWNYGAIDRDLKKSEAAALKEAIKRSRMEERSKPTTSLPPGLIALLAEKRKNWIFHHEDEQAVILDLVRAVLSSGFITNAPSKPLPVVSKELPESPMQQQPQPSKQKQLQQGSRRTYGSTSGSGSRSGSGSTQKRVSLDLSGSELEDLDGIDDSTDGGEETEETETEEVMEQGRAVRNRTGSGSSVGGSKFSKNYNNNSSNNSNGKTISSRSVAITTTPWRISPPKSIGSAAKRKYHSTKSPPNGSTSLSSLVDLESQMQRAKRAAAGENREGGGVNRSSSSPSSSSSASAMAAASLMSGTIDLHALALLASTRDMAQIRKVPSTSTMGYTNGGNGSTFGEYEKEGYEAVTRLAVQDDPVVGSSHGGYGGGHGGHGGDRPGMTKILLPNNGIQYVPSSPGSPSSPKSMSILQLMAPSNSSPPGSTSISRSNSMATTIMGPEGFNTATATAGADNTTLTNTNNTSSSSSNHHTHSHSTRERKRPRMLQKPVSREEDIAFLKTKYLAGANIIARDRQRLWLPATVKQARSNQVFVHYEGYSKEHDEWIEINSERLHWNLEVHPEMTTSMR